jgi:hypothetical protein
MAFFRKKKNMCEEVPREHDGIMVTQKMKVYVIRNSQDDSVLGTILLSDCQYNMLKEALTDYSITISRN